MQSNGTKTIIMITPLTLTAIAVLNDIANSSFPNNSEQYLIAPEELKNLLDKLKSGYLIRETVPLPLSESYATYELTRPKNLITLLDILEAIGEHINCNYPTKEEMYIRFHKVAPKLGVLNQITRTYLSQIKLTDF